MSEYIKIPDLGDGIDSATILRILINEGQSVSDDDNVLELESDKATLEIPAGVSGKIGKILVSEGDTINIGSRVAELTTNGGGPSDTTNASPESPSSESKRETETPTQAKKVVVSLKNLGDGMETVTVLKVLISENEDIADASQPVFEAESEKATVEVPADITGKVVSVFIKEGDEVSTGDKVFEIVSADVKKEADTPDKLNAATPEKSSPDKKKEAQPPQKREISLPQAYGSYSLTTKGKLIPASPKIRRFAREIGVDLLLVKGTGASSRITEEDVKLQAKNMLNSLSSGESATRAVTNPPLPDFSVFGETEIEEMNKIKQVTAKHMSLCNSIIPMVTQFDEADITETEKIRKKFKTVAEKNGVRLTMTGILVKAAAQALKQFPKFNASIDTINKHLIYKKYYNIGIAVDTDNGLMVPVIKNADQKSILDISRELGEISAKAKSRKLSPNDMSGATFTISNLGGIAGTSFTPIVSWPEVAILGVSKGAFKPVYINDAFVPRLIMPISLTYDHRMIDGADGARFTQFLTSAIAEPFALSFY